MSAGEILTGRRAVVWWLALVVFGRLYTVLQCDLAQRVFGVDAICQSAIRDIPLYLWVELIFYGPAIWLALHQINRAVFEDRPAGRDRQTHRRLEFIGTAAAAVVFYGVGVHVADTVEVVSRERVGITDGRVYDVVRFLDEGVSHYIQFVPMFFLLGWFVVHDRPGRVEHADLALFLGVAHGIERALGTIEGEKWFLGPMVLGWLLGALWLRWSRSGADALEEFFFRYAMAFVVVLPTTIGLYFAWQHDFTPPSELGDAEYAQVVIGAVAVAAVATATAAHLDHRRRRGWRTS